MGTTLTEDSQICGLPYEVWLKIVSYISPDDVLNLRRTCRKMYVLSSSESLWKLLLERGIDSWAIVSHSHNPLVGSSRPAMDVYRICRPRQWETELPKVAFASSYPRLSKFFTGLKQMVHWNNEVPRCAIFGPGIESSRTSSIVHQLLGLPGKGNSDSAMNLVEFLPGEGLGTGGLVESQSTGQRFHMFILYTKSKNRREELADFQDRLEQSPFFKRNLNETYSPSDSAKQLFESLSGMIYVVDSSCPTKKLPPSAKMELKMLCDIAPLSSPLLVLAAFEKDNKQPFADGISPASCAKQLDLSSYARPWQVCAVRIGDHSSQLVNPVNWLGSSASKVP